MSLLLSTFWTRSRLLEHLGKGRPCREYVLSFGGLPPHVVQQVETEAAEAARKLRAQGFRRHAVDIPAIRAQGLDALADYKAGIKYDTLLRSGFAAK